MGRSAAVLLLLATAAIVAAQEVPRRGSAWSVDMYDEYTHRSFESFEAANRRIDFADIDYRLLHAAVFYATNRERERNRYPLFSHSEALERAAYGHSHDMVDRSFFSHTSPVSGKRTLEARLRTVGIENAYSAENIAIAFGIEYESGKSVYSPQQNGGYFSYSYQGEPIENHTYLGLAAAVVDQWMDSRGHRANILNVRYTYLGVGAEYYTDPAFFDVPKLKVTQNFSSDSGE